MKIKVTCAGIVTHRRHRNRQTSCGGIFIIIVSAGACHRRHRPAGSGRTSCASEIASARVVAVAAFISLRRACENEAAAWRRVPMSRLQHRVRVRASIPSRRVRNLVWRAGGHGRRRRAGRHRAWRMIILNVLCHRARHRHFHRASALKILRKSARYMMIMMASGIICVDTIISLSLAAERPAITRGRRAWRPKESQKPALAWPTVPARRAGVIGVSALAREGHVALSAVEMYNIARAPILPRLKSAGVALAISARHRGHR